MPSPPGAPSRSSAVGFRLPAAGFGIFLEKTLATVDVWPTQQKPRWVGHPPGLSLEKIHDCGGRLGHPTKLVLGEAPALAAAHRGAQDF